MIKLILALACLSLVVAIQYRKPKISLGILGASLILYLVLLLITIVNRFFTLGVWALLGALLIVKIVDKNRRNL